MAQQPLISVVMPVRDAEKYLDDSISSILRQTHKDFEFIIIDDASTDSSVDIVAKYMAQDSRIVLITNPQPAGATACLNMGLDRAKGRYIARQDADDISMDNRLQVQSDFLRKVKTVSLVGAHDIITDDDGNEVHLFQRPEFHDDVRKFLIYKGNCISHPTIMFRSSRSTRYRERFTYAQEYDLYLRMLTNKKRLVNLPDILVRYRLAPQSISLTARGKQSLFGRKALDFYWQREIYGKDDYSKFYPSSILGKDILKSGDKEAFEEEIIAKRYLRDTKAMRDLIIAYYRKFLHRSDPKFIGMYFSSFTEGLPDEKRAATDTA